MPQSRHVLTSHIIFSTKNRRPMLNQEIRPSLFAYISGILRNLECYSVTVGGVEDHVHIACNLTKKHAPMNVLERIKKESTKWVKRQSPKFKDFRWQNGYGLFSVSPSHARALQRYVRQQEEHHRKETFQEEFLRILNKYGIEYDEQYLWG